MSDRSHYPDLSHFFGAYLNQDYELSGGTIEEIVSCYQTETSEAVHHDLLAEIDRIKNAHPKDLDEEFLKLFGSDFSPELWGYTTASLLDELARLLQNSTHTGLL